jgi:hypothetical protein
LDIIKPDHQHINLSYLGKIIGGEQLKVADDGTELKWMDKKELINASETEIFPSVKGGALKALEICKKLYKNLLNQKNLTKYDSR